MDNIETMFISPDSQEIIRLIRAEIHAAQMAAGKLSIKKNEGCQIVTKEERVKGFEYVKMIREVLEIKEKDPQKFAEAVLPNKLKEERMNQIRGGSNKTIMGSYSEDLIQLAIIPFKNNAGYYSEEDIRMGRHLVELVREPGGKGFTVAGIIQEPSYIHQLLPFPECSFTLEKNFRENPERVREQYEEAFMKLRANLAKYAAANTGDYPKIAIA